MVQSEGRKHGKGGRDTELASVAAIKAILYPEGFRFSKAMGQNFLISPAVPRRIAETLPAGEGIGVFEVGPGLGALTEALAERAAKVAAVELDDRLLPHLTEYFAGKNVEIVKGDILKVDVPSLVEELLPGMRRAAYANLPYYVTTPAISVLLEAKRFESITLMVQKEVARRICAAPGSPDYSAFSAYVAYHAAAKTLFPVPAGCFYPAPKVDSAVIRLETREKPPVAPKDEALFFRLIRASFENRRKTLGNSLAAALGGKENAGKALSSAGIDPTRRGETLSLEEFALLADAAAGQRREKP
ncbi:MAG: 16S rRNA (adenine(1518)-N(6)/adenine(1519)-N(6))-dimethyltransferase RsmA [Clostridia bacterium]|nr:16S rRNA (adenine(1518)-N(6)/adenine(1519)-N(6))-dimethyltransferase RsmA [Clostridia bacterium]